jgi:hypothetical protein
MIKKIELEMYFDDDFSPPDEFEKPTRDNRWRSACEGCPFYGWSDDEGFGWCNVTAVVDTDEECPIKKFF